MPVEFSAIVGVAVVAKIVVEVTAVFATVVVVAAGVGARVPIG